MKIAFDYQIFFLQNYGGISRYFKILAEELSALDQQVKIFAGINRNNYISELESSLVSSYKLNEYPKRTGRVIKHFNHLVQGQKLKFWRPDIMHETYYSKRLTSNVNCARVTTVYDMIHELFPQGFSSNDNTTEMKKAVFNRVDHILSISHSTKADLVRLFGIDDSKISVVHLGVDVDFAKQPAIQVNVGVSPFLLYVGSREGYKNFDNMLKAIAQDSKLKNDFDIIAFGGGSFTSSERQLI